MATLTETTTSTLTNESTMGGQQGNTASQQTNGGQQADMSTLVNGSQDSEGQLLGSHATTSDLSELLLVCKTVLQQGVDLLDKQLTEDAQLTADSKFLPGSTIGAWGGSEGRDVC